MYLWSTQWKVVVLVVALSAYVALFLVALYLAGVLFLLLNLVSPSHARVFSIVGYWMEYANEERFRTQLVLATSVAAGGLMIFLPAVLFARFRPLRYLLGDARFARAAEVSRSDLLSPTLPSIIVGRYRDQQLLQTAQRSVLLAAPVHSGTAASIVIPNLMNWQHSLVVLDVTGAGYRTTAGFRAKHVGDVYAFAPFDGGARSHRWNPLSAVRRNSGDRVADLLRIGQLLYPNRDTASTTASANEAACNFFVVLGLLLSESPELPFTVGEMLRLASGYGGSLTDHIRHLIRQRRREGRPLSDECIDALECVLDEPRLARVVAVFRAPLLVFADPAVDAATSESDFQLGELRRRRSSVYLRVPADRLASATPLLNLFFGQLVELNTRVRPEADPTLKYQCLLINDDFDSLGRVSAITSAAANLGEYNLRLLTVVQAPRGLSITYGSDEAEVFVRHHSLRIVFAPRQQDEAYAYAALLGGGARIAAPRGRDGLRLRHQLLVRQQPEQDWPLLPHELQELGSDCEIVSIEGCRPILARKIRFDKEPAFQRRVLEPPVVPRLDVASHQALVEKRCSEICERRQADEADSLMAFAQDLSDFARGRGREADPSGTGVPDRAAV